MDILFRTNQKIRVLLMEERRRGRKKIGGQHHKIQGKRLEGSGRGRRQNNEGCLMARATVLPLQHYYQVR